MNILIDIDHCTQKSVQIVKTQLDTVKTQPCNQYLTPLKRQSVAAPEYPWHPVQSPPLRGKRSQTSHSRRARLVVDIEWKCKYWQSSGAAGTHAWCW